jgi:hypothetical protein
VTGRLIRPTDSRAANEPEGEAFGVWSLSYNDGDSA